MPGFFGTIGNDNKIKLPLRDNTHLLCENKSNSGYYIERNTIQKFLDDKPFFENDKYILLVEGVVLNKMFLQQKFNHDNFAQTIIDCYEKTGEEFFNEFRGSFSGLFYDKENKKWLIYTNHIGDKQVFYTQHNNAIIFGSEPGNVVETCKKNNISLTLSKEAAYMILTYGFLIENHTLVQEIKKINAGHYLRIENGQLKEVQYHKFKNEPDHSKTEEEWIDGIDYHFRKAIKLQFDKDLEYGYKHITTLSGGLDSRMTVWVAHQLGYTDQLNTTFSQSDYLDETIAKRIATDLKHEWIFKTLDHGGFLKSIDEIAKITYGGATYYGLAHGKSLYDSIDFSSYGIAHTGQIGDAIIGTFYQIPEIENKVSIGDGAYRTELIDRIKNYVFRYQYSNQEIFKLYARAFNGANQGLLIFQEKTETISPFLDIDFINFCYSIPVKLRFKHKIYIDWILKKYDGASNYAWAKTAKKIEPAKSIEKINILGKQVPKDKIGKWIIGAIKRRLPFQSNTKINPLANRHHMNPLDYWYESNIELKKYLDNYFNQTIHLLTDNKLKSDTMNIYKNGKTLEKIQVLSLLSALKLILQKQ